MAELVQENWILLVLALIVGLVVAWWLFAASRRTRVDIARGADEGAPAKRNQALIDAPPAAAFPEVPPPTPEGMAGVGEAIQVAADLVPLAPAPAPIPAADGDDLTRIKGVGPKLAMKLNENGIIRFEQLARLSPNEVGILEDRLGPFKGRLTRDRVVEQAHYLERGDKDGFEAKFGSLG